MFSRGSTQWFQQEVEVAAGMQWDPALLLYYSPIPFPVGINLHNGKKGTKNRRLSTNNGCTQNRMQALCVLDDNRSHRPTLRNANAERHDGVTLHRTPDAQTGRSRYRDTGVNPQPQQTTLLLFYPFLPLTLPSSGSFISAMKPGFWTRCPLAAVGS